MFIFDELLAKELQLGEETIEQNAGDSWKYFTILGCQWSGRFFFTNKRILFYHCFSKKWEIPYTDIVSAELCMVGPLIRYVPCGIKVITKNQTEYYLSVLNRKHFQKLILSNINI